MSAKKEIGTMTLQGTKHTAERYTHIPTGEVTCYIQIGSRWATVIGQDNKFIPRPVDDFYTFNADESEPKSTGFKIPPPPAKLKIDPLTPKASGAWCNQEADRIERRDPRKADKLREIGCFVNPEIIKMNLRLIGYSI